MATAAPTTPITPSRASRFTSVKDMLLLTEDLEASLTKDINPPSTKLKRPNKSTILSRKSTNSPSLLSKNGKIFGRATKPSSASATSKPKTIDTFDVFAIPSSQPEEGEEEEEGTKGELLKTPPRETKEQYIPAKRIWTPVKENAPPEVIDLCTPNDEAKATAAGSFVSLLSSYKHQDVPSVAGSFSSASCNEPLRKGRCIGLVNIPERSSSSVPSAENKQKDGPTSKVGAKAAPKPKVPKAKKGVKTITGLAVAPYLPSDLEPAAPPTVLETPVENPVEEPKPKKPRKKRETAVTKEPKTKKPPKKSALAQPPLLSPKSVQKSLDSQNFVFGTSSQLLRTDPPEDGWRLETTGRKLNTIQTHATIHANASWDLEPFGDTEGNIVEKPVIQTECSVDTTGWGISDLDIARGQKKAGAGMWSIGSRGLLGELHSVEVMDLVDEDDLNDTPSQRVSSQQPKVSSSKLQKKNPKPPTKEATKENTAPSIPRDLPAVHWTQLPTPDSTNPSAKSSKPKPTAKDETAKTTALSDRPNFEGFTMIQLQTQIKQYGFKPVKSRKTMIDILNRCWDSAEIMVANPPSPVVLKPKATTKGKGKKKATGDEEAETAPKKRGRKPKAAAGAEDDADAPNPKRRKSSTTEAKKLDTSAIFKHIAAAIKKQPNSADPQNSSWWQRILMDETIVLEEFSEWLVKGGLQAAGVDDSVWVDCGVCDSSASVGSMKEKVKVVKMWCEARSVSFVGRTSL
ncbi:5'-flap endonuclease [Arthrobotrys musiformis]|uniref:Structure-specific endonuclease subunit SLX4 n=1 Tax=Arthrobotrys musiformis TaxID=47236 RepID=A0AAV9VVM9_9PEZI